MFERLPSLVFLIIAGALAYFISSTPERLNGDEAQLTVIIDGQKISGLIEPNGIFSYRGLQFAEAPTGLMRFKPAHSYIYTNAYKATEFPAACPQNQGNPDWYRGVVKSFQKDPKLISGLDNISEDCLYLNIWTKNHSGKRPVMVWIHGGANVNGWSYEPNYRGHNLASQDVVVVSVQYRMGPLGFLPTPFDQAGDDFSNNYGLSDLNSSLQWLQKHIQAFGGDPDNVTLFGESAGGGNIAALMLNPASKGLFHKAIIQSGALGPNATLNKTEAKAASQKFYNALEISSLEEARALKWPDFLNWSEKTGLSYYHHPTHDGKTLMAEPAYSSDIPLMIGSNANEMLMYLSQDPKVNEKLLTAYDEKIRALTAEKHSDPVMQLDYITTLENFTCPSLRMANALQSRSYVYNFSKTRKGSQKLLAYHGAEIPYVFDTHDTWLPTDDNDRKLTAAMVAYWVNFAKTGNPNDASLPNWPEYDSNKVYNANKAYIHELDSPIRKNTDNFQAICRLFKGM